MIPNPPALGEPLFEVVWPLGRIVAETIDPAPALLDLNGKTICELWDGVFRGDQIYPILNQALREKYPDVRIVDHQTMGDSHGVDERAYLVALPDLLRRVGCDAVIAGVGA